NAGFQAEIENAAGEHSSLHRIRSLACLKHDLDVLDQTAEVMVWPALLKIHQQRDRLRLPFHINGRSEVLHQARHQKRRRAKTVVVLQHEYRGLFYQILWHAGLPCFTVPERLFEQPPDPIVSLDEVPAVLLLEALHGTDAGFTTLPAFDQ